MQHPKIFLLFVTFFLAGTLPVNAQRINGGLKFGVSRTTFTGNLAAGETAWESISGLAGGVTIELRVFRGFSLVGEVLYLRMGAKTRVQYNNFPGDLTSRSSYLSIPALAQLRLGESGTIRPRIFIGGAALFVLESAILVESRVDRQIFIEEDDSIESLDYGLMAGLGVDLHLASQRFTLETRYYGGQNDVTKTSSQTGEATVLNNQGWTIMTGVLF
ncbi:MAG: porin family protein [Bacteroidetes bacterium]|nr:porin family protein [Bacteroidota bacterium]